jgi:Mrp family chromosome partitioning ATPase
VGASHLETEALLSDYDAGSAYTEAMLTLFATIRLNWDSQQYRELALLLTSPANPAEQATVAANLAIAAAQTAVPTILVDAHARQPGLAQRFGLSQSAGFCDLLLEETLTPQQAERYLAATFVPNLWLLDFGTRELPNGLSPYAARLGSLLYSLRRFLAETQEQPGLVIVNSAPVLAGADASLLSACADQTFLVIVMGRNTRAQAKRAQEQLQRAHARLTGVIIAQP